MKNNDYILVFDSGNGGQFVLKKLKYYLPNENYILFKDQNFCPYGDKKSNDLKKNIVKVLDKLTQKYKIKMIVIACNTISSMFKNLIIKRYSKYILLFVNPKINNKILQNKTLLIATKNTVKHSKLIKRYKNNKNLIVVGFKDLAKKIDDNINNIEILENPLRDYFNKYNNLKIKNIIVGCTHYNYIICLLKKIFPRANFFENSKELAMLSKKILNMYDLENQYNLKGNTIYLLNI